MGDSIGDILNKRELSEPKEVGIVRNFVLEEVGMEPSIAITKTLIIVSLPSAAAANTLRFKLFQLQRQLGHERKIILKIK